MLFTCSHYSARPGWRIDVCAPVVVWSGGRDSFATAVRRAEMRGGLALQPTRWALSAGARCDACALAASQIPAFRKGVPAVVWFATSLRPRYGAVLHARGHPE
jgi:hypothetical protein